MGLQLAVTYVLTGPDGTVATFNDAAAASYVGRLTSISGLDSPEDRETGDLFTERDGGRNNNGYAGRRPIVLEGFLPPSTAGLRNGQVERLQRASRARRADATLTWTEADGIARRLVLRRQSGPRFTGNVIKTYQLGLVSATHLIEAATVTSTIDAAAPLSAVVTNLGNAGAPPTVKVSNEGAAALAQPLLVTIDGTTSVRLDYALPAGRTVTIDCAARTVRDDLGANLYRYVNPAVTTWAPLPPGSPVVAASVGTRLEVLHRHSWE